MIKLYFLNIKDSLTLIKNRRGGTVRINESDMGKRRRVMMIRRFNCFVKEDGILSALKFGWDPENISTQV